MPWVYLAPHFDDIALSCGGLAWEQAQAGERVFIWTICGAGPPARELSAFARRLHTRWKTSPETVDQRRLEDQAACQVLGAGYRYFELPDCIYRPGGKESIYYYASEEAIFGELHPGETPLIAELAHTLAQALPEDAQVVCPLGLGGHVDHRLTRVAAELPGRPLWYYADYPYVLVDAPQLERLEREGWGWQRFPLVDRSVEVWQEAIAAHASQISTFWSGLESMAADLRAYSKCEKGIRLWRLPV